MIAGNEITAKIQFEQRSKNFSHTWDFCHEHKQILHKIKETTIQLTLPTMTNFSRQIIRRALTTTTTTTKPGRVVRETKSATAPFEGQWTSATQRHRTARKEETGETSGKSFFYCVCVYSTYWSIGAACILAEQSELRWCEKDPFPKIRSQRRKCEKIGGAEKDTRRGEQHEFCCSFFRAC